MLIDAKLGQLGAVLNNKKVHGFTCTESGYLTHIVLQDTLVTKGVASVKSSVRNLKSWSPEITHETFTRAVVDEFSRTYDGDDAVSCTAFLQTFPSS